MKKNHTLTEEHHRRPRSIGGSTKPANISYVIEERHRAWHVLVGNMNAYQIASFFDHSPYKPENMKVVCEFINGSQVKGSGENNSKKNSKISKAWSTLFEGLDFIGILEYTNNVFIDPSYHLYLREK